MVSLKFLTEVYELLGEQGYAISFSPAKQKNFLMYCNGNFIGGLFDEALYLVFTDRVNGKPRIRIPWLLYYGTA